MATETKQLSILKKGHYYVFRYTPGDESMILKTVTNMASDPKCPLDWFDAAILSHQMGQRMAGQFKEMLKTKGIE